MNAENGSEINESTLEIQMFLSKERRNQNGRNENEKEGKEGKEREIAREGQPKKGNKRRTVPWKADETGQDKKRN